MSTHRTYTIEHNGMTVAERLTEDAARAYVDDIADNPRPGLYGTYAITKWEGELHTDPADWREVSSEEVAEVYPE
jgi:hypothetical protein